MSDAIAELFAELGVKVSDREFNRAEARLKQLDALASARARGVTSRATNVVSQAIREQERGAARESRVQQRAAVIADRQRVRGQAIAYQRQQQAQVQRFRMQQKARHQEQEASKKSSAATTAMLTGVWQAVAQAALQIGARIASMAGGALIGFNANMEDAKNQIAGMLALTKKTHLSEELANADILVANLQKRAATLPGTTAEYVSMLSNIARPITDAKLGMQDLEDMTVASVIAAKAFGINAEVAARDIDQALRGQYHSVDPFSGKVLGGLGYKGEEGRSRYNALSESKRATEFKRGLAQPQIAELGAAQGKTFRGLLSTIQDTAEQFAGRIGKPLFGEMSRSFQELITWMDAHKDTINQVADAIGGALVTAFNALKGVVLKAYDIWAKHPETLKKIAGIIGGNLLAALRTVGAFIMSLMNQLDAFLSFLDTGIGQKLLQFFELPGMLTQIIALFDKLGISMEQAFDALANLSIIKQLITLMQWFDDRFNSAGVDAGGGSAAGTGSTPEISGPGEATSFYGLPDGVADSTPYMPSGGNSMSIGQISVGDLHISSTSADPKAVAEAARQVFTEELGGVMRKAWDEVA